MLFWQPGVPQPSLYTPAVGTSLWQVDPLHATLSKVVLFMLCLAHKGFAVVTVKGYLLAVSAFLHLPD